MYVCVCMYVYIHIPDCVQTVYELPLLPNNTASETFLHKSGEVRSVDGIFITGASAWRYLGEHMTWNKTFYNLLFQTGSSSSPKLLPKFLPYFSRRTFLEI